MPFDIHLIRYLVFPILSIWLLWDFNRKTKKWKREDVRKLLIGMFVFLVIIAFLTTYGIPHFYNNLPDDQLGIDFSTSISKSNLFYFPSIFILLIGLEISRRWLVENKGYSKTKATIVAIVPYTGFYYVLGRIF